MRFEPLLLRARYSRIYYTLTLTCRQEKVVKVNGIYWSCPGRPLSRQPNPPTRHLRRGAGVHRRDTLVSTMSAPRWRIPWLGAVVALLVLAAEPPAAITVDYPENGSL